MPTSPITSDAQTMSALAARSAWLPPGRWCRRATSRTSTRRATRRGSRLRRGPRQRVGGARLAVTNTRHLGGAPEGSSSLTTRVSDEQAARRDGNTVQLDRELLDMTRAAGEFSARPDGARRQVPARAVRHQRRSPVRSAHVDSATPPSAPAPAPSPPSARASRWPSRTSPTPSPRAGPTAQPYRRRDVVLRLGHGAEPSTARSAAPPRRA